MSWGGTLVQLDAIDFVKSSTLPENREVEALTEGDFALTFDGDCQMIVHSMASCCTCV